MKNKPVTILYSSDYWDGPLSGACLIEGRRYWFHCVEETDHTRIFAYYDLTPNEWRREDFWHGLFLKFVKSTPSKPHKSWNWYYEPYKLVPEKDLDRTEVGRFTYKDVRYEKSC